MRRIGAYEAKVHLGQLLDDVEAGESLEITRHGVPVARLVPIRDEKSVSGPFAVERLMQFGKGKSLGGLTFHGWEDGRGR